MTYTNPIQRPALARRAYRRARFFMAARAQLLAGGQ